LAEFLDFYLSGKVGEFGGFEKNDFNILCEGGQLAYIREEVGRIDIGGEPKPEPVWFFNQGKGCEVAHGGWGPGFGWP
jgi:hypothetical protein